MISSLDGRGHHRESRFGGRITLIALASALVLLSACGEKKEKAASQTAAKVNKEEITVHQINFVLQQQRGLKPEQAEAAGKQILERLIDQELAVQKAEELKLDRDPRVVQQMEAARREIIARAYVEKTGEAASKPTDAEIKAYYDAKPALFSARRIYSLQEIGIEAKPEQIATLREQLGAAKSINDFVEFLKANGYRFSGNQAVRPAEQLPLNLLDTFAKLSDGQAVLLPSPAGAQVVLLVGSRSEPVDEARAKPAIEQFLLNDAKRKLVESDIKALRAAAKIEYEGKFAPAPADAASAAPVVAPAPISAPPSAASEAGLSATDISKGMGFK
ncbi:MAG: peptidyl-prolyl cis-trans isomerase, EpsD family [Burkholderiales bacterium PBB1]|nr:MAG: peptidyl-prolyl cis-trans isomerase, EpsD family [Burkholderiales bacterium PBB1]